MSNIPLIYKYERTKEEHDKMYQNLTELFGNNFTLTGGKLHIQVVSLIKPNDVIIPTLEWELIHDFRHNEILNEPVKLIRP